MAETTKDGKDTKTEADAKHEKDTQDTKTGWPLSPTTISVEAPKYRAEMTVDHIAGGVAGLQHADVCRLIDILTIARKAVEGAISEGSISLVAVIKIASGETDGRDHERRES